MDSPKLQTAAFFQRLISELITSGCSQPFQPSLILTQLLHPVTVNSVIRCHHVSGIIGTHSLELLTNSRCICGNGNLNRLNIWLLNINLNLCRTQSIRQIFLKPTGLLTKRGQLLLNLWTQLLISG